MIKLIKQYCYIVFPIVTIIVLIFSYFKFEYIKSLTYDISTIIQMSGTLVGFLVTAITIFASVPKNTEYMKRFEKHQHKKIFGRCISLGIIFLVICIIIWLLRFSDMFIALVFVLGLQETIISAYYLYRLCFDNKL